MAALFVPTGMSASAAAIAPAPIKPLPAASSGVDDGAITAALERLRADGGTQFDFAAAPPPPQPPEWLRAFLDALGALLRWLEPLFTVLIWAAAVGIVLFLAYLLIPAFRDWIDGLRGRGKPGAAEEEAEWRPDHAAARDLLAEADALAAAGRYGDAVRLLLGRSIEDIDRRRPGLLRPALTARAIARAGALPEGARTAFGALAMAVERAHYALRDLTADEWQAARRAYADFALPALWQAGAREAAPVPAVAA